MRQSTILIVLLLFIPACGRAPDKDTATNDTPPVDSKLKATDVVPVDGLGQSYFPLIDGVEYEFVGTYNGQTDRTILRMRKHKIHGSDFFYFINDGDNELLTGCMFGLGAYESIDSGVRTVKVTWLDQLDQVELDGAQLMLNLPPRVGDATILKNGENTRRFVVEAFEDLRVPAGLFERCARIRIEDTWPDTEYFGCVWLAEGVGMIKWRRGTGRIDELVSVSKTPAQ